MASTTSVVSSVQSSSAASGEARSPPECPADHFTSATPSAHTQPLTPATPSRPAYYQMDYEADAAGKHIPSTKRRIIFQFGTLHPQTHRPTDDGMHVVTLSWSVTSGHTILAADGREVILREGKKMAPRVHRKFEESWVLGEEGGTSSNDTGTHLRIVARSIPPAGGGINIVGRDEKIGKRRAKKRERQFDLFIDGRSFFDLPTIDAAGNVVHVPVDAAIAPTAAADGCSCSRDSYDQGDSSVGSSNVPTDHKDNTQSKAIVIEDWTASSSAIANANEDDCDSIDGFMEQINLASRSNEEDEEDKRRRRGNGGKSIKKSISTAKKKSSRAAEKIGSSTKMAMAETSRGAKKLASEVFRIKKDDLGSGDEREINGNGQGEDEGPADQGNRLSIDDYPSFHSMHSAIMQQNVQPKEESSGTDQEDESPQEMIVRL